MRTTREKGYFYILTNKGKNVLYSGSTQNLINRFNSIEKGMKKGLRKNTMSIDWFTVKYSNILTWLKIEKNRSKVGSVIERLN